MKKLLLPLVALLTVAGAMAQDSKAKKYAEDIQASGLKEKLTVIASAEMKGRETATEGQRKAAAYIENHFRKLGLLPGNGSSYQQPFNVYQDSITHAAVVVNGQILVPNKEFTVTTAGVAPGNWNITELFFAGTGAVDTTLSLEGKWVVTDEGNRFAARARINQLMKRKVKGIILVSRSFPRPGTMPTLGRMSLQPGNNATVPYISVSYAAFARMIGKETLDSAAFVSLPKQSYNTNITIELGKTQVQKVSTNVIAVLPGSDKKDEYVFLTGHYDHLGAEGDSVIFYGADDDGSGTTAVLQMAEAFAKAAKNGDGPRRSVVFMTVSGEEKGLLGSEYYSEHPLFPLDKTTVDLNTDMVGRIDPKYKGDSMNYVYVIGEDKLSSDLLPVSDSINKMYMNLELDRRYNDITDPNQFYYRSDHYNFARKGVPIIFYFNGTHADYHRRSDTVDKINFDLMEKRVRLVFLTAWAMSNRDNMLKRDIPLNVPPRNRPADM